ncbi:hypothetical protein DV735_g5719, partial [Chaetothyriales sp. CBS 134920]
MESFEYNSTPGRVVFGRGSVQQLPDELKKLGLKAPLLLSTPGQVSQVEALAAILSAASITPAGIYSNATMHTPTHITQEALAFLSSKSADSVVSLGGGSTIGLGKAIAVRTGLPHVCIPTTYAGSEMTPILGETEDDRKTTRSDARIRPGTVIYDVNLTLTLPVALSATSGVNAIAHAVEALYAKNRNPITSLFAIQGVQALAEALPVIVAESDSQTLQPAREKAQYGAWLCGVCLGTANIGLHHKLCHTLGGSFNLPHAETHTIVLPHALAYNAPAVPDAMAKLAAALPESDGDAIKGLNTLLEKLKVKRALKDFGMKEEDIDQAAEIAVSNQYPNPRPLDKAKIREVIRRCWAGEPARQDL